MVLEATGVELEGAAAVFAALADPARLRILAVPADAGRCVCDIRIAGAVAAGGFPATVDQPTGCASECEVPR